MSISRRSARRRGMVAGAVIGSSRANRRAAQAQQNASQEQQVSEQTPSAPIQESNDVITQLKELAELKDQGILTEEEFTAKKKKLLDI